MGVMQRVADYDIFYIDPSRSQSIRLQFSFKR